MKINFFLVKLNNHGLGQKAVFAYLNAESWVTATNLEKEQKKIFWSWKLKLFSKDPRLILKYLNSPLVKTCYQWNTKKNNMTKVFWQQILLQIRIVKWDHQPKAIYLIIFHATTSQSICNICSVKEFQILYLSINIILTTYVNQIWTTVNSIYIQNTRSYIKSV
jgi:hypothetical protein